MLECSEEAMSWQTNTLRHEILPCDMQKIYRARPCYPASTTRERSRKVQAKRAPRIARDRDRIWCELARAGAVLHVRAISPKRRGRKMRYGVALLHDAAMSTKRSEL